MEDVIAVRVDLDNSGRRYFVTWGRIQHAVDPGPVEELVLRHSRTCSLGGQPVSAHVCPTMQEAALSESAPYFFECFHGFASTPIPTHDYDGWVAERAAKMAAGHEISYCGRPLAATEPGDSSA